MVFDQGVTGIEPKRRPSFRRAAGVLEVQVVGLPQLPKGPKGPKADHLLGPRNMNQNRKTKRSKAWLWAELLLRLVKLRGGHVGSDLHLTELT